MRPADFHIDSLFGHLEVPCCYVSNMGNLDIQHFPNTTKFRASRGLDELQKLKLRIHEEDNSGIGTREVEGKRSRCPMDNVPGT